MSETPGILKEIVAAKRLDVERLKVERPVALLEELIEEQPAPLNMAGALWGESVRIIAEVKRASPTKGLLRPSLDPSALATAYAENGAAAISVLTNEAYFQGSLADLDAVRAVSLPLRVPVLRKEFIFDPYQVYEARAHGADAILLIVAMLSLEQIGELLALSRSLQVQCLVEVHDEPELQTAVSAGAEIVGINNRDLRTFKTDLVVTERLAPMVPPGKIIVGESGISTREHVGRLRKAGVDAVLVGESLVTATDPGAKLRELT